MKRKPKILISGANGYLARSIRKLFSQSDNHVTCIFRTEPDFLYPNERAVVCDLLDLDSLQAVLAKQDYDVIIHCASKQPDKNALLSDYLNGNVITLDNILKTVKISPATIVIHFSSAVVYGNSRSQKLNEASATKPVNFYALSKLMSEHILRIQAESLGFSGYCLRLPSLHGNQQKGGLIDTYFQAVRHHLPLEIYSSGELKRNIMSFDEVAHVCQSIVSLPNRLGFHLYQLGSSNALSMKSIAEYLINKTQSKSVLNCVAKPAPNEVDWDFDLTRACNEIQFKPETIQSSLDAYIAMETSYVSS